YFKFRGMLLGPLGGAQQARLLAVPAVVNQRAARTPAILQQFADGFRFGHERYLSGERVRGAEYPSIVVVAANDPSVGFFAAFDLRDHIVDRLLTPIRQYLHVHLGRTRAYVVGQ